MKKVLFILLFFPTIFFGQNQSFELGLLFGGSLNSLNYIESNQEEQNTMEHKKSLRPMGGFTGQYNFTKRFSLKSKLLYHIKGERSKFDGIEGITDAYTDFHYVTLPVLAQINFSKKRWAFFCNTGFQKL